MAAPLNSRSETEDAAPGAERRVARRYSKLFYVRLETAQGAVQGVVRNLSWGGALVHVHDPAFRALVSDGDRPRAAERVTALLGGGFQVAFREAPVRVPAEFVRVEQGSDPRAGQYRLGVHFLRPLRPAEGALLGLEEEGLSPPVETGAEPEPSPRSLAGQSPGEIAGDPPVRVVAPSARTRVLLTYSGPDRDVSEILGLCIERNATDLHLKSDSTARLRIDGELVRLGSRILTDDEVRGLITDLLTPDQLTRFGAEGDLDFAYALGGMARFRVNVFVSCGRLSLAARLIPEKVPTIEQLALAPACSLLADRRRGLVLVTGPTGSGKSTTLAAMVDHVNRTRSCHIVTMEDPVEYRHREREALISQREVGRDTPDFTSALRRALRQDPDVLMVGEMRDLETIALAVTAAETGHLVFATLHTTSAVQTVDRIVDVFPPSQQSQIRLQLSDSLQGVISQVLVPCVGGGVVAAQEVLIANGAIRALIREGKTTQIENMMQTGAQLGMQMLDTALEDLVRRGLVSSHVALSYARRPERFGNAGGRAPHDPDRRSSHAAPPHTRGPGA